MREYKIISNLFTTDYSEVTRTCTVYVKDIANHIDASTSLDGLTPEQQELIKDKCKLEKMLDDHRKAGITDTVITASDVLVDALQENRNDRIDDDNTWERHMDHSTFADNKTVNKVSILLNDHDIRVSTRSAEDEYFAAIARKERDIRDMKRHDALPTVLDDLTPQQRLILFMIYKQDATYELIGKVLGKTCNAVSQNHKTILKRMKRNMDRLHVC